MSPAPSAIPGARPDMLPIEMLHDRLLVLADDETGERRTGAGIVIPPTVTMGRRLAWAKVVAAGPNVRSAKAGDRVLYDPESRAEVELRGKTYILLRERDIHALASARLTDSHAGLYL